MITTSIEWHRPVDRMPDDEVVVLAYFGGEVWPAYVDGDVGCWRWAEGGSFEEPELWAEMPCPPPPESIAKAMQRSQCEQPEEWDIDSDRS